MVVDSSGHVAPTRGRSASEARPNFPGLGSAG
jgi:hypothetical protein